jgi:uncharacterized protein
MAIDRTDVRIHHGDVVLAGTLTTPAGAAPVVAAVMVAGSGPSDRHNDTLFPPIQGHLASHGAAVLSYDKRGVGDSTGRWQASTLDDLAADAVAAHGFVRRELPGTPVGLYGHSEGGWVVLRAAMGRDDVPFVLTTGCPAVTPARQNRFALRNAAIAAPLEPRLVDAVIAVFDQMTRIARHDASYDELLALLDSDGGRVLTENWGDLEPDDWEFEKRKQDHDPIPDIAGLLAPCHALLGGADRLIDTAETVALLGSAACKPDRDPSRPVTITVFPGADHRIRLPDSSFAPDFLDTITTWVLRQAADKIGQAGRLSLGW